MDRKVYIEILTNQIEKTEAVAKEREALRLSSYEHEKSLSKLRERLEKQLDAIELGVA